jgi:hypothetical protein
VKHFLIFLLAASAIWPVSATATPSQVPAKLGAPWKHAATGLEFPAKLAGLDRNAVNYFSAPEVDVAGEYSSADGNDRITVYLFRNVAGNVPVWFDRARFFIMNLPDKYGSVSAFGIRPFTPRGQSVASGLIESYSVGKGWRTSGLMILPLDGFYGKIRVSSKTRDTASLEALMVAAINAFNWSTVSPPDPAVPVTDCRSSLPRMAAAKLTAMSSDDRMAAALVGGALVGGLVDAEGKKIVRPPQLFCREPGAASLSFGVYRPDERTDEYLLAVHDAGRVIRVGRNELSMLIDGELNARNGKSPPSRYTVSFVELDKTQVFGDFETLPLPEQAVEQVEKAQPLAVAKTWGKDDKTITIITD